MNKKIWHKNIIFVNHSKKWLLLLLIMNLNLKNFKNQKLRLSYFNFWEYGYFFKKKKEDNEKNKLGFWKFQISRVSRSRKVSDSNLESLEVKFQPISKKNVSIL